MSKLSKIGSLIYNCRWQNSSIDGLKIVTSKTCNIPFYKRIIAKIINNI